MKLTCKILGHKWGRWFDGRRLQLPWFRYCNRCAKQQEAGRGKRVDYKNIRTVI